MKLTVLFIISAFIQVSAASFAQKVTLHENNAPIEKVFENISSQTGYDFLFTLQQVKTIKPVSINVTKANLNDVLKKLFDGQPLDYSIEDKSIVITEKKKSFMDKVKEYIIVPAMTINGLVTDKNFEGLAGATVMVKDKKIATTTDQRGAFTLHNVQSTDSLIISYIGFKKATIVVGTNAFVSVRLEEATNGLDEVVVQAYGRTTQRNTTSNIGKVTKKDIEIQPIMDPLMALEGKIPGVVVTPQTGYQGGPIKIEIRGRSGVDPNLTSDPLYIIDGVPLTVSEVNSQVNRSAYVSNAISRGTDQNGMSFSGGQSPIFGLNPGDIESIEVLKDADATAIYGSRGANGVILFTTKKGRAGKTQFDLNAGQGISRITRYWDMLNTEQYLAMRREAYRNDNIVPTAADAPDLLVWDQNAYTDWQKFAYGGTGKWTNIQGGLSGGTPQTTFRLSGAFNRSTDITAVSGANQRGSVALNLNNHSLNQKLNVALSTNYSFTKATQVSLTSLSTLPPNAPDPFDSNGNLNYAGWGPARNSFPFKSLLQPYTSDGIFLTTGLNISYTIVKNLVFRTNLGYNYSFNDQKSFSPLASLDPNPPTPSSAPVATAKYGTNKNSNWVVEPQLEYNQLIGEGSFNMLLGGTLQSSRTNAFLTQGSGYVSDALIGSISNAKVITATNNYGQYRYTGVFGRISYNWKSKYIINLNGRRDGSSRFGADNRFGNFGAVGAAWIMSDEKFIRKALPEVISFLKLRGSYGLTGSDNVQDYRYLSQYGTPANLPAYGGVVPVIPLIQPNPDFHWQVNKKLEGALDISLFNDRINFEAAYYRNRCDNQLLAFPTPDFSGFSTVIANSPANVQNSGYEFLFNARILDKKGLSWYTSFNVGFNRNKLLSYPDIEHSPYYTKYRIGQSINDKYVYNYLGVDPLTGQYTYEDYNGDGKITDNGSVLAGTLNDDKYVAISLVPKYAGGMTHQFSYKGVSLTATFTFRKQIGSNAYTSIGGAKNTSLYQYENRWQYVGQQALTARLTTTAKDSDNRISTSTNGWTDASYIRLQTLAISYALPAKLLKKIGVKMLSVGINGQNLFVITKYRGLDPEVTSFPSLPPARTLTSSLTCSF